VAEKISEKESEDYFLSRPKSSQIGAWVSRQSTVIKDRSVLEEAEVEITKRFETEPIQKPDYWGGYKIKPEMFEFWQGRPSRLHDRILYELKGDAWIVSRLSP
jgi:pyridoxamine 5'-phosphate oxidase